MTRWKPNLAPVDEMLDQKQTEESRLIKIGRQAENYAAQKPASDDPVVPEATKQPSPNNITQEAKQTPDPKSGAFNPLDDASIDDLGSFLDLSSEERAKEAEAEMKVTQTKTEKLWSRIRPYTTYAIIGLVALALLVTAISIYRMYYSDTAVSTTVYILNSNHPVHEEAIRLTDSSSMSNFVQRFFISMILERSLGTESRTKFSSATAMLEWFTKNLRINREVSDHAARITFNLSGSDPEMMSKLIDGYIGSYIDSRAASEAHAPVTEPVGVQNTALPRVTSGAGSETDITSGPLKSVDEKLRKLDQTDQEYVSALRLLSKDRLIGVTDANVFRGFVPESELASHSALAKLQSRVVELAVQKNALQVKFAPSSREIQAIEQEIRGVREAMRQYLNEQRQFVQARRGEFLSERSELLRQKALSHAENEGSSQAPQQSQVSQQKRRPSLGNLPSGRFWYVGQDGTTIIAEPTYLGKGQATTAVNSVQGFSAHEMPQSISYGPAINSGYTQNQYYNPPQPVQPVNQPQHFNPYGHIQNVAPGYSPNMSAQKPAEYDQQARIKEAPAPPQPVDSRQNQGHSTFQPAQAYQPQGYQPQYNQHSAPLHTGVGQSPMMSSGLGSKFYQPNSSPVNRYQTQSLRGSY